MPPDPVKTADTKAWLRRAAEDLRAARVDLDASPPLLEDALFHCQQATEKALKAYLAWHDEPFRKTHDLGELGGLCLTLDPSLGTLLRDAAPLTEYAWRYRYPGEPLPASTSEAQAALSLADKVYQAVLERLEKAGACPSGG